MSLIFNDELFGDYMLDAIPLWKEHHQEVALSSVKDKREFSPNIKKYFELEAANNLITFTVRDDGKLVGYAVFIINTPMHYQKTLYAVNDALYLAPSLRKGTSGIKFMKWCENELKTRSNGFIKIVQWRSKAEHNFGLILERIGYSKDDIVFTKWIGD